jgi:hypothetical protein
MAKGDPVPMTPAVAVARHLEWLEFALVAARDEEVRRKGRLDKASDKNRGKRTARLAEVSAEVRELDALVTGLKALQKPPRTTRRSTVKPAASRKATPRKAGQPSKAATAAASSSTPAASEKKPATPRRPRTTSRTSSRTKPASPPRRRTTRRSTPPS